MSRLLSAINTCPCSMASQCQTFQSVYLPIGFCLSAPNCLWSPSKAVVANSMVLSYQTPNVQGNILLDVCNSLDYIQVYIYYKNIHPSIHTTIHTTIHTYVHTYIHTPTCTPTHTTVICMSISIYTCACMCVCVCVCV